MLGGCGYYEEKKNLKNIPVSGIMGIENLFILQLEQDMGEDEGIILIVIVLITMEVHIIMHLKTLILPIVIGHHKLIIIMYIEIITKLNTQRIIKVNTDLHYLLLLVDIQIYKKQDKKFEKIIFLGHNLWIYYRKR